MKNCTTNRHCTALTKHLSVYLNFLYISTSIRPAILRVTHQSFKETERHFRFVGHSVPTHSAGKAFPSLFCFTNSHSQFCSGGTSSGKPSKFPRREFIFPSTSCRIFLTHFTSLILIYFICKIGIITSTSQSYN